MCLTEFQKIYSDTTCSGKRDIVFPTSFDCGLDFVIQFQRIEQVKAKTVTLQWRNLTNSALTK